MIAPVTFSDVQAAAKVLDGVAHITPVYTSRYLNDVSRARVFLKCENFQRVGAFKFRGAYNAVHSLKASWGERTTPEPLQVVALSSGNHAQGVALASQLCGVPAHIVMAKPVNPVKKAAVLGYGAKIYESENRKDADAVLEDLVRDRNRVSVHAYNDPKIIAGQGTCALELLEAQPNLDVIVGPVGGGGLLSGTCLAAHGINPSIKIFACEPKGALDAVYSVQENRVVPMENPMTLAEGLCTSLGDQTLRILHDHLTGFFLVEESEIVQAMRFVYERLKIVIEPSSAVALAPLLRQEESLMGLQVGVLITGGNADLSSYFSSLSPMPPTV